MSFSPGLCDTSVMGLAKPRDLLAVRRGRTLMRGCTPNTPCSCSILVFVALAEVPSERKPDSMWLEHLLCLVPTAIAVLPRELKFNSPLYWEGNSLHHRTMWMVPDRSGPQRRPVVCSHMPCCRWPSHVTPLSQWSFGSSSSCAVKMARLHMLKLYFKFNLATVLKTLTKIVLLSEAQLLPSITFEAFSLWLLLNFLYSGNLISNKEPDWSVEYEFYCCVETWFYCAVRENEI